MIFKRGKRKNIADYKTRDIFKFYKKDEGIVEYKVFSNIVSEFNGMIMRLIIDEAHEFVMPSRLGSLRVRKRKVKLELNADGKIDKSKLTPDWFKTRKLWDEIYKDIPIEEINKIPNKRIIYNLNEHTDGYRFIFYWDKVTSNILNQSAYRIQVTRDWNKYFAIRLKSDKKLKNIYYE
jgi:hypothetical protein